MRRARECLTGRWGIAVSGVLGATLIAFGLLLQMIEGVVPTKVSKRKDGSMEVVYDRLGALIADAKMAGEFDGKRSTSEPELKFNFEMYHRNHPCPPRGYLEVESVDTESDEEHSPRERFLEE